MATAPSFTASFTAAPRLAMLALVASTARMWQFGQVADTMSMSSDSSVPQPELLLFLGSEVVEPVWLTTVTQPASVLVLHAAWPKSDRDVARLEAASGSLNASTTATVWPLPAVDD